jgi:hypothetical protein
MTDDEMKAMPIPTLQDEGLLFLWVTGRAMEIGRECMRVWGYTRVDEVVWVKTNQVRPYEIDESTCMPMSRHPLASTRHTHRTNWPLAQSYERAYARWGEDALG